MRFAASVIATIATCAPLIAGCGGCQDETKGPPPTATVEVEAAPKAPAPQEDKADAEEGDTDLIVWASGEPDSGPAPLEVTFSAESLEEVFDNPTYEWDFGDGSPVSKEAAPVHTYEKPGQYTARVKVTQADGRSGQDETWVEVEGG